MARRRNTPFLETIEYIGPRPQKPPRRPNFLAGWLVLLLAVGVSYYFLEPVVSPILKAEQNAVSAEARESIVAELQASTKPGDRLAAAAMQSTQRKITWDDSYYKIPAKHGDIPPNRGKAEDLIIRSYRALGIDLQELVHKDMSENFTEYPQIFGRTAPDTNIDHRMTANLQRFFERNGSELSTRDESFKVVASYDFNDYQVGDIVTWRLANGNNHIGIIAPGPASKEGELWVIHNIGQGPVWENCLFDYRLTGHYRYFAE